MMCNASIKLPFFLQKNQIDKMMIDGKTTCMWLLIVIYVQNNAFPQIYHQIYIISNNEVI